MYFKEHEKEVLMRNTLKIIAICLFAVSSFAGCGDAEKPAPAATTSNSDDGAENASGSDAKPAKPDGSGTK